MVSSAASCWRGGAADRPGGVSGGDEISFSASPTQACGAACAGAGSQADREATRGEHGGMGVYSTIHARRGMKEWILRHIAEPTVKGMAEEGTLLSGALRGSDDDARGPQVLEFNAASAIRRRRRS